MPVLHMETDATRAVGQQLEHTAGTLRQQSQQLAYVLQNLSGDWQGPSAAIFASEIQPLLHQFHQSANAGELLCQRLQREVAEWERLNMFCTDAAPLPTSNQPGEPDIVINHGEDRGTPVSPIEVIKFLDEWLKPIAWVADNEGASKQFHESMKQIGRLLNQIGQTKGYVGKFDALASLLEGSAQALSALGNVISLNEYRMYFNGEMHNSEIARTAITNLIPIPWLGNQIAGWLIENMPDPNGKWQGLVPKAYSY